MCRKCKASHFSWKKYEKLFQEKGPRHFYSRTSCWTLVLALQPPLHLSIKLADLQLLCQDWRKILWLRTGPRHISMLETISPHLLPHVSTGFESGKWLKGYWTSVTQTFDKFLASPVFGDRLCWNGAQSHPHKHPPCVSFRLPRVLSLCEHNWSRCSSSGSWLRLRSLPS